MKVLSKKSRWVVLSLILVGSVACSLGQAEAALPNPASTPYITWPVEATKQATAEAQPTPTAEPTSTAMPSPTPQPTSKPPATVEAVVEATIAAIAPTTAAPIPAAPTATPQSPTPTPFRATPTPRPRLVWQESDRWAGSQILMTNNFRVRTDEWRITWTTEPGPAEFAFKIKLHNTNRTLKTVVIDEVNPEPNSMVFRRPDDYAYTDYYLVIIADQPYTVIIEELIR